MRRRHTRRRRRPRPGGARPGIRLRATEPAPDRVRAQGRRVHQASPRDGGHEKCRRRVRNIGRNFAIYPIYRVYRWGPIFFLSAEIDFMNIFYTKK